jgi:pantetheine-phosphate adenylyltransferase
VVKAIYPGTFDPITNGHLDILSRAAQLFESVHVVVAVNVRKTTLFTLEERMELIAGCTKHLKNVRVSSFDGLTVDCLRRHGAKVVIRGLRAVSDFEYEFQMALMNKKLDSGCETVHLMPSEQYTYLNSSVIREISALGGSVTQFVPTMVEDALREKLGAPHGAVNPTHSSTRTITGRSSIGGKTARATLAALAGRMGPASARKKNGRKK